MLKIACGLSIQIAACLSEVTGWKNVNNLAEWVVKLIIANQGSSLDGDARPPCWQEHAPQTVPEITRLLVEITGRNADDQFITSGVETYQQYLLERFGIKQTPV